MTVTVIIVTPILLLITKYLLSLDMFLSDKLYCILGQLETSTSTSEYPAAYVETDHLRDQELQQRQDVGEQQRGDQQQQHGRGPSQPSLHHREGHQE